MQDLLDEREPWFEHIDDYRDALAHRIPLYIPPHAVTSANADAYRALDIQIAEASRAGNTEERGRLESEQRKLMFFRPVISHSYNESIGQPVFHPQMIADFKTVEELARTMIGDLP